MSLFARRAGRSIPHRLNTLDTDIPCRDLYDLDIKIFLYVNGGLFHEEIEVSNFTEETKRFLLEKVAAPVDWSKIPAVTKKKSLLIC